MPEASEVFDLSAGSGPSPSEERALADLKRNLSHFLISTSAVAGPEIVFGETTLKFKSKAPAKAMAILLGENDRVNALKGYINECLVPESKKDFEELLSDVPLDALNAIVEILSEAYTSFPTE